MKARWQKVRAAICGFTTQNPEIVIIGLVAWVIVGAYVYIFPGPLSDRQDVWGQFGDFVGGLLNPFIALAAFTIIKLSYSLQRVELAETRAALQEQTRMSRLTVADDMFSKWLEAIDKCASQISIQTSRNGEKEKRKLIGDDAIHDVLNLLTRLNSWGKTAKDLDDEFRSYVSVNLDSWAPMFVAIKNTVGYASATYDITSREQRLELLRLHLGLTKQLALCHFTSLTEDHELLEITRKANLLKYFPNGPTKEWFYSGALT